MKSYKVKAGSHQEGGKIYKAGDVVQSYNDLDHMFPGKFEVLGDRVHSSAPAPVISTGGNVARNSAPQARPVEAEEEPEEANPPPLAAKAKPTGRDVTKHFPKAVEEDFRVYKTPAGNYNVYDADNLAKPCNPRPISKAEVDACIRSTLAGS
jgi:hypothetical protein